MTAVIICGCTTFLGTFADVYVHRDDLGHIMTTMCVLIPITNDMWIYIYYSHVRTLAVALEAIIKQKITLQQQKEIETNILERDHTKRRPFFPQNH
jgi:hypothetical protein